MFGLFNRFRGNNGDDVDNSDYNEYDEEDNEEELEEYMESEHYYSDLGVEKYSIVLNGEWVDQVEDPEWEYVYDEDDRAIHCPNCDQWELRYHNGTCCCINCDCTFTDDEVENFAGPWHHE